MTDSTPGTASASPELQLEVRQAGCRVLLRGRPEHGSGQPGDGIHELTSWALQLGDRASMEGERQHLEAFVSAVLPYTRLQMSGSPQGCGSVEGPLTIEPRGIGHRLLLRTSMPDSRPVDLQLDDAELADLARCLDAIVHDPLVRLGIEPPAMAGLRKRDLLNRESLRRQLLHPVAGACGVALVLGLSWLVPTAEVLVPEPVPNEGSERVEPGTEEEGTEEEGTTAGGTPDPQDTDVPPSPVPPSPDPSTEPSPEPSPESPAIRSGPPPLPLISPWPPLPPIP